MCIISTMYNLCIILIEHSLRILCYQVSITFVKSIPSFPPVLKLIHLYPPILTSLTNTHDTSRSITSKFASHHFSSVSPIVPLIFTYCLFVVFEYLLVHIEYVILYWTPKIILITWFIMNKCRVPATIGSRSVREGFQ